MDELTEPVEPRARNVPATDPRAEPRGRTDDWRGVRVKGPSTSAGTDTIPGPAATTLRASGSWTCRSQRTGSCAEPCGPRSSDAGRGHQGGAHIGVHSG